MEWKLIDSGMLTAEKNMQVDRTLLASLAEGEGVPTLRFYDWSAPSATYGHFLDPYKFLSREAVERRGLHLAKRPTGGGLLFHLTDLTFSVLIPADHPAYSVNTLDNYAFVNKGVIHAVTPFVNETPALLAQDPHPLDAACRHFCMAKATKYDVVVGGKKVGGAAQRRTKHGFLHQGTIYMRSLPTEFLEDLLLPGTRVQEAMLGMGEGLVSQPTKKAIQDRMTEFFC